jgi:hypothetical protein
VTEKKKRARASSLGRDLRKFETVGGSPQKMYQGERPGPPDPKVAKAIARRAAKAAAKITAEMRLYLEAYAVAKNHADAWLSLRPSESKVSVASARRRGWEMMRSIRKHLSESEIYDLLGLSQEAITTAIADALGATSQRDFILPKSGAVISTPAVPDHQTRLAAAALGVKVRKMVPDDEKGDQPVVIQITQYCAPTATPWPGGGRVVNGTLVNTVGPAALPPARPDFTGGKGERDD